MSPKRRGRRRGGSWLGLALLFVCAIVAGWIIVAGPSRQAQHRRRVALHPAPTAAAGAATAQATAPDDAGAASASPSALVSPAGVESSPGRYGEATASPSGTAASPEPVPTLPPGVAHPAPSGVARLALIIDDCGQWPDVERAMIALPVPLTMSIMPRAPYTGDIERETSAAGQGVMLHLPMEPQGVADPGPGKVTTEMSDDEIATAVRDDLQRVPLARGVNNHEGSKASSDPRVMHDVGEVLADQGRFFIDSRTSIATVAARETASLGVPTASRTVFLDDVPTVSAVEAQLDAAADQAESRGWSIAIGHPKAQTLAALRARIPLYEKRGIRFVLVQDMVGTVPAGPSS